MELTTFQVHYEWIVVLGCFAAFFTAYGIGANDVANAFSSSVSSKAITMRQALFIAAIFEFTGSLLLGAHVTETIRSGIANTKCFTHMPAVLMWGMCSVDIATGIWLWVATYIELPVSTTHSTIGGIIGMTIVAAGADCVIWTQDIPDFPYIKGVSVIVVSWVSSPLCSGIVASLAFLVARTFVLRSPSSTERALATYPLLVWFVISLALFMLIIKGTNNVNGTWDPQGKDLGAACGICIGGGLFLALIAWACKPFIRAMVDAVSDEPEEAGKTSADVAMDLSTDAEEPKTNSILAWVRKNIDVDPTAVAARSGDKIAAMHESAEKFPPKTEQVFRYMQVITASMMSFSHGANDVANAMGPFSAVWFIWKSSGKFGSKKNDVGEDMYWILAIGGLGIVVGLATFGYKIIWAIGVKLTKITPSRGFAIELGAMFTILLGSRFGLPLSTTHCAVGATVGVSMTEGRRGATNWWFFLRMIAGWCLTMVINGLFTACIFSMGYWGIHWDDDQMIGPNWRHPYTN
eukprot:CAMPEP_0180025848 /NCGR_PEP_ID=MMETSP0984-20121128/24867_1 /TAXON_ID=483367 /ORGANISM="non described non described, Strain CCMP 2436" /LENGTH=519 /DNA_ID=CAMNT_0021950493 /DNA_START=74 /DNA_END=1633 /DNA_ORIENTATION=-